MKWRGFEPFTRWPAGARAPIIHRESDRRVPSLLTAAQTVTTRRLAAPNELGGLAIERELVSGLRERVGVVVHADRMTVLVGRRGLIVVSRRAGSRLGTERIRLLASELAWAEDHYTHVDVAAALVVVSDGVAFMRAVGSRPPSPAARR